MPGSNGSLVISIKPKTKENVLIAAIYSFTYKNTATKTAYFCKIYYDISYNLLIPTGANVALTSQIRQHPPCC
jgi:hypothetical protein